VQTQPNSDSSTVTVFLNNIIGSPDEIDLAVMKDGPFSDWFMVNGKQLLLTRSLTQQHQLPEHITLRLRCARRRLIPTIPVRKGFFLPDKTSIIFEDLRRSCCKAQCAHQIGRKHCNFRYLIPK
jgi:hypothetical protein